MTSIPTLIATEGRRWTGAAVAPAKAATFELVAKRLTGLVAKARYITVQNQTKVPWFVIAVIHERECSQNWNGNLAQGDPWNKESTHVPAGRGPFKSWEEAAYDALVNCAPKAAKWTDWSVGGMLTILEEYNGLGYANRGVPSPYIWAGTNQYKSGKYVRDGVYDPLAVDAQLGCAGLLLAMAELDKSIVFGAAPANPPVAKISPSKPAVPVVASPVVPAGPSVANPAPGSIGAGLASLFSHLFSHL